MPAAGAPAVIRACWPAPAQVRAFTTTRHGGVSRPPYATLNLALHVGDEAADVRRNRELLHERLALPGPPCWLRQTHGSATVEIDACPDTPPPADGALTSRTACVLALLTADCLPVLLCDRAGTRIGALHAGWRGLAAGIVEAGVARMQRAPQELLAWLGPAIGAAAYEVGIDVRDTFVAADPDAAAAFTPVRPGHWLADLALLARQRLERAGVRTVHAAGHCTWTEREALFSHRRDGRTGRMATLIWLAPLRRDPFAAGGLNPAATALM
ncbi:MAG: peptidoglycan editing factor PgeF [Gammaproteobacteria bacterium]|nr:peptidoglycan editing factor PgeF [Gammaproteobacteria bacterium]